jgi:metallophosphoesterase (TIGR00282 family)
MIRVFLCGDVFGPVGMRCVSHLLPALIRDESIDFTVVNGENASNGIGLSAEDARILLDAGADVITGGNHTFEKRDYWPALDSIPGLIRPANYPESCEEDGETAVPGKGSIVVEKNGVRFAVLNLQGREDMIPLDCPFRAAKSQVSAWLKEDIAPIILVDFHAESSEEKEALAFFLAGKASAVIGTHTHVQTADERILSGFTAYMTDLGMVGPIRSVIGVDPEYAIKRNITQVLYRMEPHESRGALRGLIVDIDPADRKAVSVSRIDIPEPQA